MPDILTADTWLLSKLSGDSTLTALVGTNIYQDVAPKEATYPLVKYIQMSPPLAVRGVGPAIIMWDEIWLVKAVGKACGYPAIKAITNEIRTLLHAASGSTTGGIVIGCVEIGPVRYTEIVDGITYRHLGIEFRIFTQ